MTKLFLLAALGCFTLTTAAFAEETCTVSGPIMTKDKMTQSLRDRGFVQVRSLEVHNGCYEAKGIDNKGKRFELELNGATGEIVNAE